MRRNPGPGSGQGGFAAVDALVAVTILSSSLALSLAAAGVGVRASRAAAETRQAEMLLRDRIESSVGREGAWSGRDQGLDWRVEARRLDGAAWGGSVLRRPCERDATARARRTGRTYRITTIDICVSDPEPRRAGA